MITQQPTKKMLEEWKETCKRYQSRLSPNRKSGEELLCYLQSRYVLTEILEKRALGAVSENVLLNEPRAEKLPAGHKPAPRAFYLENEGDGQKFYLAENRDSVEIWGGEVKRIFVGIDLSSGFYMVEGSTLLWDELCAFQGLDEKDLQNYAYVAQYISALRRMGKPLPDAAG